jgi:predicted transcriptional regulator of viral defense system
MSCAEVMDWYLTHRIPVLDVRSRAWSKAREQVLPRGYQTATCLRRLLDGGRLTRLHKGLYLVRDPVREPPTVALVSGLYADLDHYLTTDAALAVRRVIDQPIPVTAVVLASRQRPVDLGETRTRPILVTPQRLAAADRRRTTVEGFRVQLATPEQAVVDALSDPGWMYHWSLMPEVLAALDKDEIRRAVELALKHRQAAAQRLGYLLDEIGRRVPASLASFRPSFSVDLVPGKPRRRFSARWRVYE